MAKINNSKKHFNKSNQSTMNFIPKQTNINTPQENYISNKKLQSKKATCTKKSYWKIIKHYLTRHIVIDITCCFIVILCGGFLIHHSFVSSVTYHPSTRMVTKPADITDAKRDAIALQNQLNKSNISQNEQSNLMNKFLHLDMVGQHLVYNHMTKWTRIMPTKSLKLIIIKDALNDNSQIK